MAIARFYYSDSIKLRMVLMNLGVAIVLKVKRSGATKMVWDTFYVVVNHS
jgi:hypothetical protein